MAAVMTGAVSTGTPPAGSSHRPDPTDENPAPGAAAFAGASSGVDNGRRRACPDPSWSRRGQSSSGIGFLSCPASTGVDSTGSQLCGKIFVRQRHRVPGDREAATRKDMPNCRPPPPRPPGCFWRRDPSVPARARSPQRARRHRFRVLDPGAGLRPLRARTPQRVRVSGGRWRSSNRRAPEVERRRAVGEGPRGRTRRWRRVGTPGSGWSRRTGSSRARHPSPRAGLG